MDEAYQGQVVISQGGARARAEARILCGCEADGGGWEIAYRRDPSIAATLDATRLLRVALPNGAAAEFVEWHRTEAVVKGIGLGRPPTA